VRTATTSGPLVVGVVRSWLSIAFPSRAYAVTVMRRTARGCPGAPAGGGVRHALITTLMSAVVIAAGIFAPITWPSAPFAQIHARRCERSALNDTRPAICGKNGASRASNDAPAFAPADGAGAVSSVGVSSSFFLSSCHCCMTCSGVSRPQRAAGIE
jgi:hypothetical protein